MTGLDVWMDGTLVATLQNRRGAIELRFSADTMRSAAGSPLVSVSMPVRQGVWRGDIPDAFFEGLLPEGEVRRMLAYDYRVRDDDALGLLAQIGRDCAGAMQLLPAGARPDAGGGTLEPLTDVQVGERLRALQHAPLGVDERVRISLAGVQQKLVLAAFAGGWALPQDGAPSTHIFKPEHPFLEHSVANEALCMRAAHHAEVDVAEVERQRFGNRDVLVVRRFDRTHDDQPTRRIHQEDIGQAHGVPPRRKYEEHGGPSLRSTARLLRDWTRGDASLLRLLDITTFNVAIGNADAHAKNLALLHHASGAIELAPAYDLMSTRFYPQPDATLGMFVNGRSSIDDVTLTDLVTEAASWGLDPAVASARVARIVEALDTAVTRAADEVGAPAQLARWLVDRASRLARQE